MKKLSALCVLFIVVCLCCSVEAQGRLPRLFIIYLNQDSASLATPSIANLIPGDTLQFVAVNGNFDVLIRNAYKFLKIKEDDLKLHLDSSGVQVINIILEILRNSKLTIIFIYIKQR